MDTNYEIEGSEGAPAVQMMNSVCMPVRPYESPGGPSMFYQSLWLRHVGFQYLEKGKEYTLVWDPSLERRPRHVVERYGENRVG